MDRGSIDTYIQSGGPAFNYALQRTGSNLFQTLFAAHTNMEMYNAEKPSAVNPFAWRPPLGGLAHTNRPAWKHFRLTESPWLECGGNLLSRANATKSCASKRPTWQPGGPTSLEQLEALAEFNMCYGQQLNYALCDKNKKFKQKPKFYLVAVKSPSRWLYSVMRNCPDCPLYPLDDDSGLGSASRRGAASMRSFAGNPAQALPARYVRLWNEFYGRWRKFEKANPGKVKMVRYEDVISNCKEAVRDAAEAVNVPFRDTEHLDSLHAPQGCHGSSGPKQAIFMSKQRNFRAEADKYLGWSWMNQMSVSGLDALEKGVDTALMEDLGYNATELMEHIAERRRKTSASRGGGAVLRGGATPSGGAFERHPAVGHRSADARAREMQHKYYTQRGNAANTATSGLKKVIRQFP